MHPISRTEERGQSLVLIAIAAIALIAFVSLAVDGGMAYNQRRIAQNAADAAAIAGTYEIRLQNRGTTGVNQSAVRTKILDVVQLHGVALDYDANDNVTNVGMYYTDANGTVLATCQIGSCPGATAALAWGVRVDVANPFTTFFAGVIGWHQMNVGASSLAVTRAGARSAGGYWAIVATNMSPGQGNSAALQIQGGGQVIQIYGDLHSNGDFQGPNNWVFSDQITYGVGETCKQCEQSQPTAEQKNWTIVHPTYEDYLEIALADGVQMSGNVNAGPSNPIGSTGSPITYINGNLDCDGATLHGLIVVTGDVEIDSKKGPCNGSYLIAAGGDIKMSGGVDMLTGDNGVYQNPDYDLLEKNGNRFVSRGDFDMSGSSNNIVGAIISEGTLGISGSSNQFFGALIGNYVEISGAGHTVTYEPEYFPPQPDFIELLQ